MHCSTYILPSYEEGEAGGQELKYALSQKNQVITTCYLEGDASGVGAHRHV